MKTGVSAALKAHLATNNHTLATCWKVTRRDAVVLGFTDHDSDIVFGGLTYLAASGYTASNVVSSDALNVDNLQVEGMLQTPSITVNDLRAGLWDYAAVEIFIVNWADLTMGRLIQRVGTLGEVSTDRGFFRAELRGLTQAFSRTIGELTSPGCRASLGDERCKVDLAPFTVVGSVTGVRTDNMTLFDSARTEPGPGQQPGSPVANSVDQVSAISLLQPGGIGALFVLVTGLPNLIDGAAIAIHGLTGLNAHMNGTYLARSVALNGAGLPISFYIPEVPPPGAQAFPAGTVTQLGLSSGYFDFGVLTWTSGLNLGLSMEVKSYVPTMITLVLPMPYEIQVGDTYSMHAGCDKAMETCRDRFNNIVNFRGEPYLSGIDRLVQVARRQ